MRKRWIFLLIMASLLILISFCCCQCPPPAPCPIEGLLIEVTDLPPAYEWLETGSRSSRGAPLRMGVERIGTVFSGYELFDGVSHEIYRFKNKGSASRNYADIEEIDFSVLHYSKEWELPDELSQIQLAADRHTIGCNLYTDSGAEECQFLAQYGPYLVRFSIRLHGLKFGDVIPIIEEIDRRTVKCLSLQEFGKGN